MRDESVSSALMIEIKSRALFTVRISIHDWSLRRQYLVVLLRVALFRVVTKVERERTPTSIVYYLEKVFYLVHRGNGCIHSEHRWARVLGQGGGGSTPGGVLKKIFRPPSAAEKFFRQRRHRGVKNFFRWGVYLVDRGVILPKYPKKWPHRGVKNFFPQGASHPGVHPPCFFRAGCRANFRLKGGGAPRAHL